MTEGVQIERPLMTKAVVTPVKPQERTAPIAQAECSDTDWESARTNVRGNSIEKNGSGSYEGSGGTLRGKGPGQTRPAEEQGSERAQSADSRISKNSATTLRNSQTSLIKERRRSMERPRIFSALKNGRFLPSKLVSNY